MYPRNGQHRRIVVANIEAGRVRWEVHRSGSVLSRYMRLPNGAPRPCVGYIAPSAVVVGHVFTRALCTVAEKLSLQATAATAH
jgi:hypothetical protein